jgi:hypothetical protein
MAVGNLLKQWRLRAAAKGRIATIDVVKAAPPPSPLAPVELTDPTQVAQVMDLAARIGDILLAAGTSNRDTKAHIHAVTSAYGLLYAHVDITLNTITLFTSIGVEKKQPVTIFRVVSNMRTDFSKLSEVDRLIRSIRAGATPPDVAEKILDGLYSSPAAYGFKTALLGWGGLGASVAVMLGGSVYSALLSFVISVFIVGLSAVLRRQRLPVFFQNFFGGFVATFPTAVAWAWAANLQISSTPSHVIGAGIVVMLANLTLVQSLQDGITGAPVTGGARFFETLLLTSAIIAGVGFGIQVAAFIGIDLPPLEALATPGFGTVTVKVLAGAVAAMCFALGCYAEVFSLLVAAGAAAFGSAIYYSLLTVNGFSTVLATAMAATVVGFTGGLLARRYLIPPLMTGLAGITPLLPGLAIYRGMYAWLNEQMLVGFTNMAVALSVASALAAGVVLGEWAVRQLRRPPRINFYRAFRRQGWK